jgi:hypothetical protein
VGTHGGVFQLMGTSRRIDDRPRPLPFSMGALEMRKRRCSATAILAAACAVVGGNACSSAGTAGVLGRDRSTGGTGTASGGSSGAARTPTADGASGSPSGIGLAGSGGSLEGDGSAQRPLYGAAATLENTGADCEVRALPDPAQLPEFDALPDPFEKLDGTRVTKRSEWRCRRQEILAQAQKYIYGQKPPRPEKVAGSVTTDEVSVDVEHDGKRIHFSADVVLPSTGRGPFPVIINLGTRGGFGGIRLGERFILDQGVARFLKHGGQAAGTIKASAQATGNPSRWIQWQTPTLLNDPGG